MSRYDDIINLPRPARKTRIPMPLAARAAQFAPFAALTGHNEAIEQTARRTIEAYNSSEYGNINESTSGNDRV